MADTSTDMTTDTDTDAYGEKPAREAGVLADKSDATEPEAKAVPRTSEDETVYPHGLTLVLIIVSLCLSVFLVALDQTIIAPALGAITAQFSSTGDIGWYGSAYLLTSTALQPIYGRIYYVFSVKYTFLAAVFIFEIGSLVCAVAPTSNTFIGGRALAGVGTAGLFAGAVVILSYVLPLRQRPAAFGLIGAMWGVASVAGPLLGGVFTDHATWRWCFYVNLPIGGLAMVSIFAFLHIKRENNPDKKSVLARITELDLLGAAILIPAVVCLLLALQWGGTTYAWNNSRIIGLFIGFGLLAILFTAIQIWKGDAGMLPPRLFKIRDVLAAMMFSFFFGAGFFPLLYYLSLYFQAVNGDSAVQAGIKLLPLLISTVLMSVATGGLITAVGYYNPFILPSMVLYTVGAGMITTFGISSPLRVWFGYQVLCGLGIGVGFQSGVLVVQNSLPLEWIPIGTSCVQFFQMFGGAIFLSVAQSLFQNGLVAVVEANVPGIDPTIFINSGADQVREVLASLNASQYLDAVLEAYLTGLRHAFFITVACAACAFVAASFLSWKKLSTGAAAPAAV